MRVLNVGDLHAPATRKGYFEFCCDLYDMWDCDTVVLAGDVIDWHAISFHAANPECPGPRDEYELAKLCIKKWYDQFPNARVCIGNHDERPQRLARVMKIPDCLVKDYNDMWSTPKWKWDWKFVIDGVQYKHGTGCSGIHPAWNLMNKIHQSCAIGHCHTRAGVKWGCNENSRFFAMDVGCGIDERMWQFAYGRDYAVRPFLAAGVIIDGVPYSEPMRCGRGEPYHDSKF